MKALFKALAVVTCFGLASFGTAFAADHQCALSGRIECPGQAVEPLASSTLSDTKIDNAAASGDTVIVSAVAAKTTRIYRIFVLCAAATNLTPKDGSTALTGPIPLAANQGLILDYDGNPWFTDTVNTNFVLNSSAATQCSGRAYYVQN